MKFLRTWNGKKVVIKMNGKYMNKLKFDDDNVVMRKSTEELQQMIL